MQIVGCSQFFFGFFFLSCWQISMQSNDVVRETKYGKIRGSSQHFPQAHGPFKQIHQFLGIPYARAPVKELRFEPPQPPKDWKPKIFDARQYGNICPHSSYYRSFLMNSIKSVWPEVTEKNFSEDCLYLNIYAPATPHSSGNHRSQTLYPVLFYIHGGSYLLGTPVRDKTPGHILPQFGIVLVTIQYRLGPLGFLTTGDSVAPGNYGILDQVQALKWVNENIAHLGGDPKRITIAGNSAGGSSVGLHLLSPLTKGLFHGAIMESGVELSPFAILPIKEAVTKSKTVASKLLCNIKSSQKMVDCLRTKDVDDLSFYYESFPGPVVDNYYLPDTPENLRKNGSFHDVPLIVGFTKHDGSHSLQDLRLKNPLDDSRFRKGIERYIQEQIEVQDPMIARRMADALEFQYYSWHNAGDSAALYKGLVKMATDYYIIAPSFKTASFHSERAPTFVFNYHHISNKSRLELVVHSSNVDYGFGAPMANLTASKFDDQDRNISHFIVTCYTNFVKYGNPTPDLVGGVNWTEYTKTGGAYLNVGARPEVAFNFHPSRIAFWNYYEPKIRESFCSSRLPARSYNRVSGLETSVVFVLMSLCICLAFMI